MSEISGGSLLYETAEQSQINNVLVKDFYNGIRFAQGNDFVHGEIYEFLRFRYGITWSPAALDALPSGFEHVEELSHNFKTPRAHSAKRNPDGSDSTTYDFVPQTYLSGMSIGSELLRECIDQDASGPQNRYIELRRELMCKMIAADAGWIMRGRPLRHDDSDPYSSQIREYVLGLRKTNCTWDAILSEMQNDIASGIGADQVARLRYAWESKPGHEDTAFYPDTCPPEVIESQRQAYAAVCLNHIGAAALQERPRDTTTLYEVIA